MRAAWIVGAIVVAAVGTRTAAAQQMVETVPHEIDAPKRSFELGIGAGYTQGTGEIRDNGERVSKFAGPGGEVQLDLGYRIDHRWMIGAYGTYAQYDSPTPDWAGITARGVSTGLQAQVHLMPFSRIDPWIGIGAGYRGLFSASGDGPIEARHGVQLARLRIGVDVRASTAIALGPVVGVDGTMFTGTRIAGQSETGRVESENLTVAPFFFAGLAGRFDVINQRANSYDRTLAAAF